MNTRPAILVTGASGLLGRGFLEALGNDFYVYAMARRSPVEAGVVLRPNVRWIRADIGDPDVLQRAVAEIRAWGGVRFVVHLAGYYDYANAPHPEYRRTNIDGTRNVLESVRLLEPEHFVFVSSLTVSRFPDDGRVLDESSPPDAAHPYGAAKREAEALVAGYAKHFRCSVVRPGAVFSDWCEYPPLYHLLTAWTGKGPVARAIAGRGESALPYLHVDDMSGILLALLKRTPDLPRHAVYVAGHDGCTSHNALYSIARRYCLGAVPRPLHVPRIACAPVILGKAAAGMLRGTPPFERLWMLGYIDRRMPLDASRTRRVLAWQPAPRLHVERRLLLVLENMQARPLEWKRRNDEAAHCTAPVRPHYRIHEALVASRDEIVRGTLDGVVHRLPPAAAARFEALPRGRAVECVRQVFRGLEIASRIGERRHALLYAREVANDPDMGGCGADVARAMLGAMTGVACRVLASRPALRGLGPRIDALVGVTFELAADGLEAPARAPMAGGAP